MKKLILLFVYLIAGHVITHGQTKILNLKAVRKGEEPKEVMDAIQQHFPKAIVEDLRILPAKLYGEHWLVDIEDYSKGTTPEFFLVNLKDKNEHFKAVYDPSGKLLSSKTTILESKLPVKVTSAIASQYPGWMIVNTIEKITTKESIFKEAYHVEIQKGQLFKTLFFDNNGNTIRAGSIE